MGSDRVGLEAVNRAIDEFRQFVTEDIRDRMRLSERYNVQASKLGPSHWPAKYSTVFRTPDGQPQEVGAGVYLHFDADDRLLYVGSAVSSGGIGTRLNAYFQGRGLECRIVDPAFGESCGVRVVPFDPDIEHLALALEWFLIGRLEPPLNRRGRRAKS